VTAGASRAQRNASSGVGDRLGHRFGDAAVEDAGDDVLGVQFSSGMTRAMACAAASFISSVIVRAHLERSFERPGRRARC
jgi:hypothetical protein